jgi:hypothetical protein
MTAHAVSPRCAVNRGRELLHRQLVFSECWPSPRAHVACLPAKCACLTQRQLSLLPSRCRIAREQQPVVGGGDVGPQAGLQRLRLRRLDSASPRTNRVHPSALDARAITVGELYSVSRACLCVGALSQPPSSHAHQPPPNFARLPGDTTAMAPLLNLPPLLYLTHPPAIALPDAHSDITSAARRAFSPDIDTRRLVSSPGPLRPRVPLH